MHTANRARKKTEILFKNLRRWKKSNRFSTRGDKQAWWLHHSIAKSVFKRHLLFNLNQWDTRATWKEKQKNVPSPFIHMQQRIYTPSKILWLCSLLNRLNVMDGYKHQMTMKYSNSNNVECYIFISIHVWENLFVQFHVMSSAFSCSFRILCFVVRVTCFLRNEMIRIIIIDALTIIHWPYRSLEHNFAQNASETKMKSLSYSRFLW